MNTPQRMALCLMLFLLTAGVVCLCSPLMSTQEHLSMADAVITRESISFSCPMQLPSPFDSHMIPFASIVIPQGTVGPVIFFIFAFIIAVALVLYEQYHFYIKRLLVSYGSFQSFSHWVELFSKGVLHPKVFA